MAAEVPGSGSFKNLPQVMQSEISSFLPEEDLASLSEVSGVFHAIFNNPAVWTRVAKKLDVKVTADPKQDVVAYYRKSNKEIMIFYAKHGHEIPRSEDIFTQRRLIESYVLEHPDLNPSLLNSALEKGNIEKGNIEIVKLLIQHKVPMPEKGLYRAILKNRVEIVKFLLNSKVPLNFKNAYWAASRGKVEVIKLLLEAKVPIDEDTVLWASHNRNAEIVKLLLDAKAPVDELALDEAIGEGHTEVVKLLIKDGRVEITQQEITFAEEKGFHEIADLLRAALNEERKEDV